MTAKEKLRKAIEDLSELEAEQTLAFIADHHGRDPVIEYFENAPEDDEPLHARGQSKPRRGLGAVQARRRRAARRHPARARIDRRLARRNRAAGPTGSAPHRPTSTTHASWTHSTAWSATHPPATSSSFAAAQTRVSVSATGAFCCDSTATGEPSSCSACSHADAPTATDAPPRSGHPRTSPPQRVLADERTPAPRSIPRASDAFTVATTTAPTTEPLTLPAHPRRATSKPGEPGAPDLAGGPATQAFLSAENSLQGAQMREAVAEWSDGRLERLGRRA